MRNWLHKQRWSSSDEKDEKSFVFERGYVSPTRLASIARRLLVAAKREFSVSFSETRLQKGAGHDGQRRVGGGPAVRAQVYDQAADAREPKDGEEGEGGAQEDQ